MYFSPDVNDNLSSFVGPFIAGKAGKVLKKEPSQRCCNEEFETPDTFLLVPRPSAPPLSNFTLAPLKSSTTHALDESVAGLNLAGFKESRWMLNVEISFSWMGAVSSAYVLATFSSAHILSFRFTNKSLTTFWNYGARRKLFPTRVWSFLPQQIRTTGSWR